MEKTFSAAAQLEEAKAIARRLTPLELIELVRVLLTENGDELRKLIADIKDTPETLLPCPFCGGVAHYGPQDAMTYAVRCRQCAALGPVIVLPDDGSKWESWEEMETDIKAEAIARWQRRA